MAQRAPRPPRKTPRTAWGRFLVAERLKRGWRQDDAFDHFRDRFGWAEDSRASYGNLERGSAEPDTEKAAVFLSEYGYDELPAEEAETAPAQDPTTRLAMALETMAEELTAIREEREAWTRGVVAVLRSYGDGRVPADLLDALAAQLPEAARP